MGTNSLLPQRRALGNAEAVLFVDDNQPQFSEFHLFLNEGMGADGDIYIAVTKPVPGAETVKISGTLLTRVFEGGYSNTGKWVREMAASVKDKGKEMKKLYFFYTTCPKCAKAYGKNYTVLLAEI